MPRPDLVVRARVAVRTGLALGALATLVPFAVHTPPANAQAQADAAVSARVKDRSVRYGRALVVTGPAGLTPGTIAEGLSIPPNTLSFHLKELTHAGLVTQERAGRNIVYRAAFDRMNALLAYLTANCCQGAACAVAEADSCHC